MIAIWHIRSSIAIAFKFGKMPSRKRAKGKARKAKQKDRDINTSTTTFICLHGCPQFKSADDVCIQFVDQFQSDLFKLFGEHTMSEGSVISLCSVLVAWSSYCRFTYHIVFCVVRFFVGNLRDRLLHLPKQYFQRVTYGLEVALSLLTTTVSNKVC